MSDCIFCKIAKKEIPTNFIYEDEDVMVFPDIHPAAQTHLLVVPKMHVTEFLAVEDPVLFQKVFVIVQKMIEQEGLRDKPHRVGINGGGAQDIDHLHIHLLGPIKRGTVV